MKESLAGFGFKALRAVGRVAKQARDYVDGVKQKRANHERKFGADKDLLIQDPVCGVYIPKSQAVIAKIKGEWVYFCSRDCMVNYRIKTLQDGDEERNQSSD